MERPGTNALNTRMMRLFTPWELLHATITIGSYGKYYLCIVRLRYAILIAFLLLCRSVSAEERSKVDSLKSLLKTNIADTSRVNTLNALSAIYISIAPDTALKYAEHALNEAENAEWAKGFAEAYHGIGYAHYIQGNYEQCLLYWQKALESHEKQGNINGVSTSLGNIGIIYTIQDDFYNALEYYLMALKIDEELGNNNGIARHLGSIGIAYKNQGNYPKAIEYYFKALEMDQKLGNKRNIAAWLGNIGSVYNEQGDYPKALEYYFKGLKMDEEIGRNSGIASKLSNIGTIYQEQGDYPKALEYFIKALKMNREMGRKSGIAICLGNIGNVYKLQGDSATAASNEGRDLAMTDKYPKALEYYFKALKMREELGAKILIATVVGNIGSLYAKTGSFEKAEEYLKRSLNICDSVGALLYTKTFEQSLSNLYDTTGRYQLALEHYKKYSIAKDSMFNEEKSKDLGKLEARHEFETTEAERQRVEEEQAKQDAAAKSRRDNLQYSGILIFLVLVFAGVFLLGRFKIPIRLAEGMIFFAFLLFFEFMLVMLDSYIEDYSGGEPAYKLLFNAVLAGLIFPLHSLFETKLKKRLVR